MTDDGAVLDIARRSPADLKPLASGLSVEVLDWAVELRTIWTAIGLSMNQFASLHPVDKGTISRYLNGQRVPRDRWFLNKLLAIQAEYGQPVTPAVREHLAELQLRALEVAHPHEYRVRRVNDELEIALTGKLEAERYARALEEQLADRNRQVSELAEAKGRLRVAWDADRVAMQADCERLTLEIGQITGQVHLARERAAEAERRCQLLEDVLDHLDAHIPASDEYRIDTKTGLLTSSAWELEAVYKINRAVRADSPVALALIDIDDYGRLVGDKAIRSVADALRSQLCAYDLACRFGNGEFGILLPSAREADAINVAEKIRCHIAAMAIPVGDDAESRPSVTLTVSIGVAALDGVSRGLTDMLAVAEAALSRAKQPRIDTKTGLLNASTWEREASVEIDRAARMGSPLALALVDIDHFKLVNDTYGHLVGDKALRAVTDALRSQLRVHDLAGRFGGEEFIILLPDAREVDALALAEQARRHIAAMAIPVNDNDESGPSLKLTISVGVAALDGDRELTDLLAAADAALYRAKATGRNKTHVFTASTRAS